MYTLHKRAFETFSERGLSRSSKLICWGVLGAVGEWSKLGLTDSKLDKKNL